MVSSRLRWKIIGAAFSGLFIFGCAREPVIARVNGEAITKKEVEVFLSHGGIKGGAPEVKTDSNKAISQELLAQLINDKLIFQAAKKEDIKVDNNEVMASYRILISSFPKEEDYLRMLKEKGMSKELVLKSIERDLTVRKLKETLSKDLFIPEEEIKGFYEENIKSFDISEQFRLSVIKVSSPDEARRIKGQIAKGAGFEDLAGKYPAGHGGPGGGETGWVTINTFPTEMAKEIRNIKKGAFGGPIKGREGYYLIKVQDKMEKKRVPLGEVRENIRNNLIQQKREEAFQRWFQEVKGKAKIEILEKG